MWPHPSPLMLYSLLCCHGHIGEQTEACQGCPDLAEFGEVHAGSGANEPALDFMLLKPFL